MFLIPFIVLLKSIRNMYEYIWVVSYFLSTHEFVFKTTSVIYFFHGNSD